MYSYHNYKKNRQKQRIFTLVNKLTDVDTESSDDKYIQKLEKSDKFENVKRLYYNNVEFSRNHFFARF